MFHVRISLKAQKEISKLGSVQRVRVLRKIKSLRHVDKLFGRKLKGTNFSYRIKVGSYRVLYTLDNSKKEIIIFRVAHRKTVYK